MNDLENPHKSLLKVSFTDLKYLLTATDLRYFQP